MLEASIGRLILIHGFIGAGKTTFAKALAADIGAIRFSPDEWMTCLYGNNPPQEDFDEFYSRIETMIWKIAEELLRSGNRVILDFGFWQRSSRDDYCQRAAALNIRCDLYRLDCNIETMRERVRRRSAEMPEGQLFIDDNAFDTLLSRFEPLDEDEQCIEVYPSMKDAQN